MKLQCLRQCNININNCSNTTGSNISTICGLMVRARRSWVQAPVVSNQDNQILFTTLLNTHHYGIKVKTNCLGIRAISPSGATHLHQECFSDIYL
jgi:hypothetical protein